MGEIGVLICDDVAGIRELLRTVVGLSPRLRVVGEASDGREAIAEAARTQKTCGGLNFQMSSCALTDGRYVTE